MWPDIAAKRAGENGGRRLSSRTPTSNVIEQSKRDQRRAVKNRFYRHLLVLCICFDALRVVPVLLPVRGPFIQGPWKPDRQTALATRNPPAPLRRAFTSPSGDGKKLPYYVSPQKGRAMLRVAGTRRLFHQPRTSRVQPLRVRPVKWVHTRHSNHTPWR